MGCEQFCPDRDGAPTTLCVDSSTLEGQSATLGDGACHSRCDFGLFPGNGCREDYGCVNRPRANEPGTVRFVCVYGEEPDPVSDCQLELSALGVNFTPAIVDDASPEGEPNLTCHVEDPVRVHPPIHGVDVKYYNGDATPNILMSCAGAIALTQTVDDMAAVDVAAIRHIGTYNCRVISGTSTLSQHSFGDAIDIFGFDLTDGTEYTLEDHWEHDNAAPQTTAGAFLYDAGERWFESFIWNIILTPNYNAAHDNHFHVDLTPGSHFIGYWDTGYFGPSPWPGE